jgi:hypothetical protein
VANYQKAAGRAARRYGLDPGVFKAMIRQESGFNKNARSPVGAQGIAQFMPATARSYGVNLNDNRASDDLDGAARYLRDNLKKYGSYEAALSVYNSGRPDAYKDPSFAGGQTFNYVRNIMGAAGGSGGGTVSTPGHDTGPQYRTVPGVDNFAQRQQLKLDYFSRSHDPNALLQLQSGLSQAQDTPSRRVRIQGAATPGVKETGVAFVDAVQQTANRIDKQHRPYLYGGGHAGKSWALDCSAAVSKVLGIDPRVSGDFEKWGKPGRGKVTVFANRTHVLLEINGHYWGTSASNPQGGAGWIPRSQISAQYLKGFTARHA